MQREYRHARHARHGSRMASSYNPRPFWSDFANVGSNIEKLIAASDDESSEDDDEEQEQSREDDEQDQERNRDATKPNEAQTKLRAYSSSDRAEASPLLLDKAKLASEQQQQQQKDQGMDLARKTMSMPEQAQTSQPRIMETSPLTNTVYNSSTQLTPSFGEPRVSDNLSFMPSQSAREYYDTIKAIPAPRVDIAKASVRFEAMKSWEIDALLVVFYITIVIAICYTIAFCVMAHSELRLHQGFRSFVSQEPFISEVLHLCTVFLAIFYIGSLLTHRTNLIDEQYWVAVLVGATFFGENPLVLDESQEKFARSVLSFTNVQVPFFDWMYFFTDAIYTGTTYFYFVASAHSFRLLKGNHRTQTLRFYAPKVAMAVAYCVLKIALSIYGGVAAGFLPFSRIFSFYILTKGGRVDAKVFEVVVLIMLMDLACAYMVAREIFRTKRKLANVPYLENRTKQLGFRIFVYKNIAFIVVLCSLGALLEMGLPKEYFYIMYDENHIVQLFPIAGKFGLGLMYFVWILVTVIMYLPVGKGEPNIATTNESSIASSTHENNLESVAGYLYCSKEWRTKLDVDPSRAPLGIRSNLLVVETMIQMLNLSWLAYLPGNPKQLAMEDAAREGPDKPESSQSDDHTNQGQSSSDLLGTRTKSYLDDPLWRTRIPDAFWQIFPEHRDDYHLVRHIVHEPTDCHVLILEQYDRVLVTFSGTRGMKNWMQNLAMYRVQWDKEFESFPVQCESCLKNTLSVIGSKKTIRLTHDAWSNPRQLTCGCFHQPVPVVRRSTFAAQDDNNVIEAFTNELRSLGEMKVHAGFARMYAAVRNELLLILQDLYSPESKLSVFQGDHIGRRRIAAWRPIFFTGHSLGGSLSTLASFDVARHIRRIGVRKTSDICVYTFGGPKVGNPSFAHAYDSLIQSHWRIVIASDFFTKMPRYSNYLHVGVQVLLDLHGTVLIDPSFVELVWWHLFPISTAMHSRACYYLAIRAWCEQNDETGASAKGYAVNHPLMNPADAFAKPQQSTSHIGLDASLVAQGSGTSAFRKTGQQSRLIDLLWPWSIHPKFLKMILREEGDADDVDDLP